MEPANDPNQSSALDNAPSATPSATVTPTSPVQEPAVEPIVTPTADSVVEPIVEPTNETVLADKSSLEVPVHSLIENSDFINSAKELMQEKGMDVNVVMQEIKDNAGVTQGIYNDLIKNFGKSQADMMVSGYNQEITTLRSAQAEEDTKIYDIVGGKDQWDKIAAWTGTKDSGLNAEAAKEYNAMLAQGGVQAALAAKAIKEAYMASPGFTQDANLMTGDRNPAPGALEVISRAKYLEEKKKAMQGNDAAAVQSLTKRAEHTMKNHPESWRTTAIQG